MTDIPYLLFSLKHNAWWALGDMGYTEDVDSAQRYTEAQAVNRVVRSAGCGDRTKVTLMVAAPENWAVAEDHPDPSVAGPGAADTALSAEGAPAPAAGAPAQDPDAPPYASPFAYRAERGWRLT